MPNPEGTGGFQPGQSGNPAGRPRGSRNRRTVLHATLEQAIEQKAPAIIDKLLALALEGDKAALRLTVERLIPPVKEAPITFDLLPSQNATEIATAVERILEQVAGGELTIDEGQKLIAQLEVKLKSIETAEISERLDRLEEVYWNQ